MRMAGIHLRTQRSPRTSKQRDIRVRLNESAVCQWVNLSAPETKNTLCQPKTNTKRQIGATKGRARLAHSSRRCGGRDAKNVSGQVAIMRPIPSRRLANWPAHAAHASRRGARWISIDGLPSCPSSKGIWKLDLTSFQLIPAPQFVALANAWVGASCSRRRIRPVGTANCGAWRSALRRSGGVLATCHFTVRSRDMPCHLWPMTGQYTL